MKKQSKLLKRISKYGFNFERRKYSKNRVRWIGQHERYPNIISLGTNGHECELFLKEAMERMKRWEQSEEGQKEAA